MDVARIEAISPQQIDWRRLTAKDIIKYEQQGVDVPAQYLEWAREIKNSLDTDDDVTYEMASTSPLSVSGSESADISIPIDLTSQNSESVVDTANVESMSGENVEDKTVAQQKREDLQNDGVSLRNQAIVFTQYSNLSSEEVLAAGALISGVEAQSINEIESLENYMVELLAKAEATQKDLKNEVNSLNKDDNNTNSLGKINKLQSQLEQYGIVGQASISAAIGDLNQFNSLINSQSTTIFNARDYGDATVGIGNDLLTSIKGKEFLRIFDYIAGTLAVGIGEDAVTNSNSVADVQMKALASNSDNLSSASGYQNEVSNVTGVKASVLQNSYNTDSQTPNNTKSESEKEVKVSQNDGTDETAKMSTNIDEILKRKIRKGENINPA